MLQEFSFQAPATKAELITLLQQKGDRLKLLAGGTDLLVDIRGGMSRPEIVVDIKQIPELRSLSYDAKTGLSIGAAVRCVDVINDKVVREQYPLLVTAASQIGSFQLRNRATIVGNICTASPAADMAPALLCLDASVEIWSPAGRRTVSIDKFFTGVKKTVMEKGECVARIIIPAEMGKLRGGMKKLKRIKGHDLALASVCMVRKEHRLRAAIGACAITPVLLKEFSISSKSAEIVKTALEQIKPIDDIRASAKYRLFMVQTYIEELHAELTQDVTAKELKRGGK